MYMISDPSRSSSKTPDERLVVARTLLKRVREQVKSIVYNSSKQKNWILFVLLMPVITKTLFLGLDLRLLKIIDMTLSTNYIVLSY